MYGGTSVFFFHPVGKFKKVTKCFKGNFEWNTLFMENEFDEFQMAVRYIFLQTLNRNEDEICKN